MKNNCLIITILFYFSFLQNGNTQETFLNKYISPDDKAIYSIIETDDNHLIFCGSIWTNPELTGSIGTMSKISFIGELINSENYDFTAGNSRYVKLINPSNTTGSYFLLGSEDSVGGNKSYNSVFIHSIDNELNILERRNYGMWPDTVNNPWDFEILDDSTAYILSFFKTSNSSYFLNYSMIKAHLTNGEYDYFIADDNINKAISGFMIDEVNELIKVNYRTFLTMYPWNPIANISYDLSNVEVVMPENEFFSQTKLAKKNDSTYFLSGAYIDDNTTQRDLGIAEYNLRDSLLKQIKFPGGIDSVTYPGAGRKNILVTSDYIWVMGWYNCLISMSPCQDEPTYIMLNKLTHDLELVEQIFYGGDGVYNPNDIIETSDNHIVVVGDFFDPHVVPYNCHFDPFVLKVNSEGLIVNTQNNELPLAQEAIVFPNPGSDYLQVKLAVQHKTATLQLFDLNGRLVHTEEINSDMQRVNTATLPAGVYPYRITANKRVIGSGKWVKE
jgi:hypothetical protein